MADLIKYGDSLRQGTDKLNESIKASGRAETKSDEALGKAGRALDNSESTQEQLDTIVIEGDSSVEAAQARVDEKGESHSTLKARIDDGFEKTNAQLAETDEEIERNKNYTGIAHKEMYKKEIVLELPGRFDDYDNLMLGHTLYMHTQAFTVLEEDNLLFVLYVPHSDSTMKNRWVAVYDWTTGDYISCFGVVSEAWEGIVVKYEGDNRYLYVGGANPNHYYDLHKYDITIIPPNLYVLDDYDVVDLGMAIRFGYHNGNWLIVKETETSILTNGSRSYWQILDDNFTVKKSIRVDGEMRSLMNATTTNVFPKVQGLAMGSDFIVASFGASTQGRNTSQRNLQQGVVTLNTDGNIIKRGAMDNEKLFNKYIELGYEPNKVENEGVWVDKNDNIYTLNVINTTHPEKGLLIIKEGANSKETIDFIDVATPLFSLDADRYSNRYFPSIDNKFYNPITGDKFNNITEMVRFARDYDLSSLSVYVASGTDLKGINNETVSFAHYHFISSNAYTMYGTELSPNGQRNLLFSSGNIRVLPFYRGVSLISGEVEVTKNKIINLDADINSFDRVDIIYQYRGYNNKVFTFYRPGGRYEIRDFNIGDSLSSTAITFIEIMLEKVANQNKLEIKKCIQHYQDGATVTKSDLEPGTVIKDIIGIY